MPFRSPLIIREVTGSPGDWQLEEALVYRSPLFEIRIPKGFVTDFASVPRFLWALLPPHGKHQRAAVVHDYLYRTNGGWSRRISDTVFLDAMKECRVSWWRRTAMWLGVRIGGAKPWKAGQAVAFFVVLLVGCATPEEPDFFPPAIRRIHHIHAQAPCECHRAAHGQIRLVEDGQVIEVQYWSHGKLDRRFFVEAPPQREVF